MKLLNIKKIAFIVLNLAASLAFAQTNYLDGLNYSTSISSPSGQVSGGGVINSNTSITLANGTFTTSINLPERVGITQSYVQNLNPGSYIFSFNYSGPAGNFQSLGSTGCSIGGGSLPPCPTSGLMLTLRNPSASTVYLNAGSPLIIGKNSATFTLSSISSIAFGLTYWTPNSTFTISNFMLSDGTIVPVVIGPSLTDTQTSVQNASQALQSTYALQNSVLANSFTYDCTLFDKNNICVSGGARNTAVQAANGLNNTSALLIAAYRPIASVRVGAYADQNLSINNGGSTVNLGNNTPLIGLFAAWNERQDGTGSEVKVSAAYGQKNTTINRGVVGSGATASEAGSGSSQLNSQGFQVLGKHGFGVMQDVVVSPYVGIRYTQNNMGGYTEGASTTVTTPLTYSALNTNATTALAGVGASYRGIPQTNLFASAGVETDTNTANGSYNATWSGTGTLSPVNFNANPVKTRATATLGATYDVVKNQRLGITGIYRQESYQAVSTTTVMATYTVGF